MVADAGCVGGEAWTSDGQTNGINFIQFVCPSTLLHSVVADAVACNHMRCIDLTMDHEQLSRV